MKNTARIEMQDEVLIADAERLIAKGEALVKRSNRIHAELRLLSSLLKEIDIESQQLISFSHKIEKLGR